MAGTNAYRNMYSMGTRLDILLPDIPDETADVVFMNIRNEVGRLENLMSIFIEDSVFSYLNKTAAEMPARIDYEIYNLLEKMLTYNTLTLGYFDITLGTGLPAGTDPDQIPATGNGILLDPENLTVSFTSSSVKIDSGAFGKGIALNSVKKILLRSKIPNAFISFGESSVLALGKHPYGDSWKVGIRDLFQSESNVYVFDVVDGSVSTSGNSPNNRGRYPEGHIIDPFSKQKVGGFGLMCVAGPDPVETEVLSTALMVSHNEDRLKILENFPGYRAVGITYPDSTTVAVVEEL
jgi:thiamine biosynthesis lipoprotein